MQTGSSRSPRYGREGASSLVDDVVIRRISSEADASACAEIMCTTEPWLTLGRTREQSLRVVVDPGSESYVGTSDGAVVGFVVIIMHGAFVGYIKSVAVREDWRALGLGRRLVGFAEERIFRESPNAFLCVSSFNPRARSLYERLGYQLVGELTDYVIRGHSEWLLRKSRGPLVEFTPA